MPSLISPPASEDQALTRRMLGELGVPVNRRGFQLLCAAIPRYSQDVYQGLAKELYPYLMERCNFSTCEAVERSMRGVIFDAWKHRNPAVWERYFPTSAKQPTNKQFISTLAEHLNRKKSPPGSRRGKIVKRIRPRKVYYLRAELIVRHQVE